MDMSSIHALAAGVSMATSGASSIRGGNWRVFEQMLQNASATVVLGATVSTALVRAESGHGHTPFYERSRGGDV